jgi:O-antigen/teichoic acid export membrane protein
LSLLKKNITANFAGGLWAGLMNLIFIPLFIKFLGVEAYGLIGIFISLQGLFVILEMGLSGSLNREIARLSVLDGKNQEMRDLLRTLEIPYWSIGSLIGATIIIAAPFIASQWLKVQNLSPATVARTIMVMGVAMAFQWPLNLYSGGLLGLQKQVLLNILSGSIASCRGLGAVIVLWLVSPTIEAFFAWQVLINAVHTLIAAILLWKALPPYAAKAVFRMVFLRQIGRFAAGMGGITVLAVILSQLDKIILSKMLSLEAFGYYTLANGLAMNLYRFVTPIANAIYPRFTNMVSLGAQEQLAKLYHQSAQSLSVCILPVAIIIALFSKEIIFSWTQKLTIAEQTFQLASILVMGNALNGLMHIPLVLQLANGWTRLTFYFNLISVLFIAPLTIMFVILFGALGAAIVWVMLNIGYIAIMIPIMHHRLLPAEKMRWYKQDVGLPLLVSLVVAGTFRLLDPFGSEMICQMVWVLVTSGITLAITALVTPVTRDMIFFRMMQLGWLRGN